MGNRQRWLPSGKLTVCYWKWSFIVDLPIKNGDFSFVSLPEGVYIYIYTYHDTLSYDGAGAMVGLHLWIGEDQGQSKSLVHGSCNLPYLGCSHVANTNLLKPYTF